MFSSIRHHDFCYQMHGLSWNHDSIFKAHSTSQWLAASQYEMVSIKTVQLYTQRLILRAYREQDLEDTVSIWNDLATQQLTALDHVVPRGPSQKEIAKGWFEKDRLHVILEEKSSQKYVGFFTIRDDNPKNRDGEIAMALKPEFTNKGYGTEVLEWGIEYAFKGLNLHRLSLGTFGNNERAIHVYKKLGFVEEGRLRKANWVDGRWVDIILMSILDEDWWSQHDDIKQNEDQGPLVIGTMDADTIILI